MSEEGSLPPDVAGGAVGAGAELVPEGGVDALVVAIGVGGADSGAVEPGTVDGLRPVVGMSFPPRVRRGGTRSSTSRVAVAGSNAVGRRDGVDGRGCGSEVAFCVGSCTVGADEGECSACTRRACAARIWASSVRRRWNSMRRCISAWRRRSSCKPAMEVSSAKCTSFGGGGGGPAPAPGAS